MEAELKAYIAKSLDDFVHGVKIILASSLGEAQRFLGKALDEDRRKYAHTSLGEMVPRLEAWVLEERALEKGIFWDGGLELCHETP